MNDDACPHDDHEDGYCLDCGEDITQELVAKAEWLVDSQKD